jgi:hypothetical protein
MSCIDAPQRIVKKPLYRDCSTLFYTQFGTCTKAGTSLYVGKRFPEFFSNDYLDPELKENPPATPLFDRLQRNILASNPRSAVTKMIRIRTHNTADPGPDPDFT